MPRSSPTCAATWWSAGSRRDRRGQQSADHRRRCHGEGAVPTIVGCRFGGGTERDRVAAPWPGEFRRRDDRAGHRCCRGPCAAAGCRRIGSNSVVARPDRSRSCPERRDRGCVRLVRSAAVHGGIVGNRACSRRPGGIGVSSATDRAAGAGTHRLALHPPHRRVGEGGGGGRQLSGGEAQRVSLARPLLTDAPVLVLDEVTAFADP
ncbi:ATP-binding cassette domain-containing protein [Nocardia sp. 2YAB30]|uniref:ATP-binding cassette domain-containing protein n=1 Tax=unclassified Nocardia TaxID=2637762 RepID=UPI003F99B0ED